MVVSNTLGSITSANATLTVTAAPTAPKITTQPASQSVQAGQSATFSVVATGTAPLAYQWRRNGTAIAGATGALYKTPVTTSADNGAVYSVVVSNTLGSITSASATLTVTPAPTAPKITTQPASQSVQAGQSATFSVVATGTAPLNYQWRRNGTAIAGATSALYKTPATTSADNGAVYSVVVSNTLGSITSGNATLTVTAAPAAPKITTQPANQSVPAGQSATFSVVATGTAPLAYQWRRNGTAIAGATSALYNTPATTSADNGAVYSVVVSNTLGSITSANATLTVTAAVQGTDVVTYKNNAARTGANLTETTLTPVNVNSSTFGKLHFLATDGKVDAQPLYLSALNVGGAPATWCSPRPRTTRCTPSMRIPARSCGRFRWFRRAKKSATRSTAMSSRRASACVDGVDRLVRLLDHVRADRGVRLLAIPRAAPQVRAVER